MEMGWRSLRLALAFAQTAVVIRKRSSGNDLCYVSYPPSDCVQNTSTFQGKHMGNRSLAFVKHHILIPLKIPLDLLFRIFHGCMYFINLHHLSGIILNAFVIFILLGNLVNDVRGRRKSCWKAVFNLANDESPAPWDTELGPSVCYICPLSQSGQLWMVIQFVEEETVTQGVQIALAKSSTSKLAELGLQSTFVLLSLIVELSTVKPQKGFWASVFHLSKWRNNTYAVYFPGKTQKAVEMTYEKMLCTLHGAIDVGGVTRMEASEAHINPRQCRFQNLYDWPKQVQQQDN